MLAVPDAGASGDADTSYGEIHAGSWQVPRREFQAARRKPGQGISLPSYDRQDTPALPYRDYDEARRGLKPYRPGGVCRDKSERRHKVEGRRGRFSEGCVAPGRDKDKSAGHRARDKGSSIHTLPFRRGVRERPDLGQRGPAGEDTGVQSQRGKDSEGIRKLISNHRGRPPCRPFLICRPSERFLDYRLHYLLK